MLTRDFFRKCALFVAAALLVVAISSCSQDIPLVLCNINLDVEDGSRSFNDVVFSSSYTLYYSTVYKGSDTSYYGIVSNQKYDSKVGILLSQGRWEITCEWKDANGNTVATGTTRDIWVNLNTSSFIVYLDENGKGSVELNYEVFKAVVANVTNAVTDVKVNLTLSKWNGSAFDVKNNDNELESTQGTVENSIKIYNHYFENIDSGKYLLVIQTIDNTPQTSESILFTDVIGFVVKPGHTTVINGSCEVINGVSGKNEYITWEDDPKNPEGTPIDVGNTSSGYQTDLTNPNTTIVNNTIYVIQEDKKTSGEGTGSMDLSTDGIYEEGPRIVTPPSDISFGINMNGTDVTLSTQRPNSIDEAWNNQENTTIVQVPLNTKMTLFNYKAGDTSTPKNTWGLIPEGGFKRRYHANANIAGGTLNIVGPTGKENSISNIPIVFQGPAFDDCDKVSTGGDNNYKKQGAINLYSPGGKVVLDGNVTVSGCMGITSWDKVFENSNGGDDPTLTGKTDIQIYMKNGSSINAVGDKPYKYSNLYSDIAYGIFLRYDESSERSVLNIVLDNSSILTSRYGNQIDKNEAGIYIYNFSGQINISLKNGAEISTSGTAIKLYHCTGPVEITVEKDCIVKSGTDISFTYDSNGSDKTETYAFPKNSSTFVVNKDDQKTYNNT